MVVPVRDAIEEMALELAREDASYVPSDLLIGKKKSITLIRKANKIKGKPNRPQRLVSLKVKKPKLVKKKKRRGK